MKTVIAGSRNITDPSVLIDAIISSKFEITEVVSGGARGVDRLGEDYAKVQKLPIKQFLPDWSIGKMAGPMRNRQMASYADAVIVIWNGHSKGSRSMIEEAKKAGKKLFVYKVPCTERFTKG